MTDLMTPLVRRLGLEVPIIQAPMGSAAAPELVGAVTEAGGLGLLALTWLTDRQAQRHIQRVRQLTDRPFGANLVLDFPVASRLAVCLDEGVPVISTFWGDPAGVHRQIRAEGRLHMHTVGSVEEALRAADAGVDVIVAQGWGAGGHVRGTVGTMALVPAVADAVAPLPVVAAGGIADGRGVVAALALGAQAVWLGTRFLTADEAFTHEAYRRRVITATADDTAYGYCFADGWPGAAHRTLRNVTLARWEAAGSPSTPHRPGEGDVVATDRHGVAH